MATALAAMLFSRDHAALAHIGDSHAFRLRGGRLCQITEDHRIGNLVAEVGLLAPILAWYVDVGPDRSADLGLRDLRAGTGTLLCSDGLSSVADDRPHRDVLTSAVGPADDVLQPSALSSTPEGRTTSPSS
jgi:PPM family protein phosphatase